MDQSVEIDAADFIIWKMNKKILNQINLLLNKNLGAAVGGVAAYFC